MSKDLGNPTKTEIIKKGKCILMNGEISKSGKHTWGMERKGGGLEESGRRFNKTIPFEML